MAKSRKWIVFKREWGDKNGGDICLGNTHGLTNILDEHWDFSGDDSPEPGYRFNERVRVESLHNPDKHGWSTHYHESNWKVDRVEEYTPDVPIGTEYTTIVVCWCVYDPIDAPLIPVSDRIVSPDSFGGDEVKYQAYLASGGDVVKYEALLTSQSDQNRAIEIGR